jgi:hypothetical protein
MVDFVLYHLFDPVCMCCCDVSVATWLAVGKYVASILGKLGEIKEMILK